MMGFFALMPLLVVLMVIAYEKRLECQTRERLKQIHDVDAKAKAKLERYQSDMFNV